MPKCTWISHQAVPFQVSEVHAWPLSCSPTPEATALIPFSLIYLLFNPFSFEQSAWGMKVSPIPLPISIYRSISSHHQGCCNSSVSHHKHFTGSRKLGTATEQSPSVVVHFLGLISSDTAGQMLPRTSLSEQAGFTPQHRFHTDSFLGNLSSLDFLLRNVSVHHLKKCITFQDEVSWNRSIDHS